MVSIENSPDSPHVTPPVVRLDEPNDINRVSPWRVDFRQLEAGPMEMTIRMRAGAKLQLVDIFMSRAVHQTGVSPAGTISVGLLDGQLLKTWMDADLSATELVCFGSTEPFDGVGVAGFSGSTISCPTEHMEQFADDSGLGIPESLRGSGAPRIIGSLEALARMRRGVRRMMNDPSQDLRADDQEEALLNLLLAVNSDNKTADRAAPDKRSSAVRKAVDLMVAGHGEAFRIGELCREAGASWRTLDRGFKERFGFGPKRYDLNLRLNRVRSRLLDGDGVRSVSDAANEFGFWHIGDFSREYLTLFGELPSQTGTRRMAVDDSGRTLEDVE